MSAGRRKFFACTDIGNSQRLVHYFGRDFRYVPAWDVFLVWGGTHWKEDRRELAIMRLAKRVVGEIETEAKATPRADVKETLDKWRKTTGGRQRLEAMVHLSKSEPGVAVEHEALDQNLWALNTLNGTVDLKSGKLKAHNRLDLLTRVIPLKFDANAKAPQWERFLAQVLPDVDVRTFLQRFLGYCATGTVEERLFVIFYGGGRNGKSVFLRLAQKALGKYAGTTMPGLLMAREKEAHPTEVAALCGLRLAVASEVKKGRTFDEEQVKRLTGNDRLTARRMREDPWEFEPTHKLLIAANHKPRVKDASKSFWDRIALIPFDIRIDDKKVDRQLIGKLTKELGGILGWMVRGCVDWQKNGLALPETIISATQAYKDAEDRVGRFLKERCAMDVSCKTPQRDLMLAAKRWSEEQNIYSFSANDLTEHLSEIGCRVYRGHGNVPVWEGLKLASVKNNLTLIPGGGGPKSGGQGGRGGPKPPLS
jgi:putative DNA primase/helicase